LRKIPTLYAAFILLGIELTIFILIIVDNSELAAKIISMVTANHIGGRLAFIAVGLENDLSSPVIIAVIILYNTTYVCLMYYLFFILSVGLVKIKFVQKAIDGLRRRAVERKMLLRKWNRFFIFIFVWIPLPWTGAAIGSYIAHLEGYSTKDIFMITLPAMWIGVISWTLWFDELYNFIERFGRGKTMLLTVALLVLPLLGFVFNLLRKRIFFKV